MLSHGSRYFLLGDQFEHLRVEVRISCDDVTGFHKGLRIIEVRDQAAGLLYEQTARGEVPWLEPQFPEAVEASTGDVSKIERCRTGSPDAAGSQQHGPEHPQPGVQIGH